MLDAAKVNGILQRASRNGDTETVRMLLDAGADVHAGKDEALRWASAKGRSKTVRVLLNAGADVNADGGLDDFPLLGASRNGDSETVRMLLDAGADVHAGEDRALQLARRNGDSETVKMLQEAMEIAQAVASLRTQFQASTGKELTQPEAIAAFRIVRKLDGEKSPAP